MTTVDTLVTTSREPPLVVDMDGTLLSTDSLMEGIVALLRARPWLLFSLPWWLRRGRAAFKREIASRIPLDAARLPYDEELLEHLRAEQGHRALVLCTAADARFAAAVAEHLGLFDEVIATTTVNLTAEAKARALVERFGEAGFDYAGNDVADVAVFACARRAIAVNPTPALQRRIARGAAVTRIFESRARRPGSALLEAMRPHQWVKNLLVFVPMLATLDPGHPATAAVASSLAFAAFSLVASSAYLLNDILDVAADRQHPRKRHRPVASGALPLARALVATPLLLLDGLAVALRLGALFTALLGVYWLTSCLYTFWLKRVPLLDTSVLAGLYTMRILAGAAAIAVVPSVWLLAFSMFFFLSLALAKRHAELVESHASGTASALPGREYRPEDLTTLISQGAAAGYAAVLVLALFIDSDEVRARYNNPEIIWLICPLLLYWINKLWLNSQRRELDRDPLIWALTNRVSRAVAVISVTLLLLARFLPAVR